VRAGEREQEQPRQLAADLVLEARKGGRPLVDDGGAVDEEQGVSPLWLRFCDAHL
jgi:hypothetical protein